jgi:putative solute:sodium symporter small subunit
MQLTDKHHEYWRKTLALTAVLLVLWFLVTFVVSFYARELAAFNFFGWPFSFWMGAQGALLIYVVLIGYYARTMNRMDVEYGVDEGDDL